MKFVEPLRKKRDVEAIKQYFQMKRMDREGLLFTIGINSCLRISDILTLKWEDVAKKGKIVDQFTVKEQKTGKTKTIKVNESMKQELYKGFNKKNKGYIFISKSHRNEGEHWSRQYAWRILKEAAKEVGIEQNIGTHTMRKTFGYFRREMGVPLHRLMRVFNHSSEAITLKYLGYTQEEDNEMYDAVNL